jgi:hypothetical protein
MINNRKSSSFLNVQYIQKMERNKILIDKKIEIYIYD